MIRFLRWGVLSALAAAVVFLAFLALACSFVQFEMFVAASMKFGFCEKGLPFVFIGFLFVFATGIVPSFSFKRLGVRNVFAYLSVGVLSGALAEYCYMFENDIWYSWDFAVPPFDAILTEAFREMPSLFVAMTGLLPFSIIPLAVGLLFSGLYWLFIVRRTRRAAQ
jgi:hypothetical protein